MSSESAVGGTPRAMIHKRILDAARDEPNVSVESLAASVSGASPTLVESVLERYGDPADDTVEAPGREGEQAPGDAGRDDENEEPASAADDENGEPASAADDEEVQLTEKQREVLDAIREAPTATQAAIGETLGVTAATICARANGIPDFDWRDRADYVETDADRTEADARSADTSPPERPETQPTTGTPEVASASDESVAELSTRLTALEETLDAVSETTETLADRVEELGESDESASRLDSEANIDDELAVKIVRACLSEETLTDEDALAAIQSLLR